jgi:hypothetical protein
VYPWYLLYLTPFLFARSCAPLLAWTFTALPIYAVWELARHGHRWFVPAPVEWIEYGVVIAALIISSVLARRDPRSV